jgi:flagellar hook-length control protein FliK
MNSASILMNMATPAAAGTQSVDADAGSGADEGFTAALAALQESPAVQQTAGGKPPAESPAAQTADAEDVSALAIIASLLMQGPATAANEATGAAASAEVADEAAAAAGADLTSSLSALAAAQSPTATSAPTADAIATSTSTAAVASQDPAAAALRAMTTRGRQRDAQDALDTSSSSTSGSDAGASPAGDRLLLDKLQEAFSAAQPGAAANASAGTTAIPTAAGTNAAAGNASPSVAAAVHLAATLTRDGAPDLSTPVHTTIHEPVGSPRWTEEIGSRLVLMSMRGQQEGSLTLTPEHLGPLEVQISVNKDTANVWFGAQHADTRAALTDAMPRLRELLAASGLSLGQSGVSEQAPRRAAAETGTGRGGSAGAELSGATEVAAPAWRPLRSGLIDTYA